MTPLPPARHATLVLWSLQGLSPPTTVPVAITTRPSARRPFVRRLVVVDDDHRVVGIVSRIDLLKAYMRDDAAIKSDVEAIVRDVLWLRDLSLGIHVNDGVVSIDGKVRRKSDADLIASLARRLAGVVEVRSSMAYDEDDARLSSDAREIWFRPGPD